MKQITLFAALFAVFLAGCSSDKAYVQSPVDKLIKGLDNKQNFTLVLYDMDMEEHTFSDDIYKHKYKVVTMEKAAGDSVYTPKSHITDWYDVDQPFFDQHVNDMGMEIASKTNGVVKKQVAPAGYSQYVGNSEYGQWKTDNSGNSFWEFYGKYAMMRSLFGMTFYQPVYRSYYTDYSRYRSSGRPYYGSSSSTGTSRYGTFSKAATTSSVSKSRTFSSKMASNSSFKNKVGSSVSRSSSSYSSGSRTSPSSSKTSKSSSRYGSSSSSSSRSRSSSSGGK